MSFCHANKFAFVVVLVLAIIVLLIEILTVLVHVVVIKVIFLGMFSQQPLSTNKQTNERVKLTDFSW